MSTDLKTYHLRRVVDELESLFTTLDEGDYKHKGVIAGLIRRIFLTINESDEWIEHCD